MIQAVFFDWFGTLAHYYPPRENIVSQVLNELGFNVSLDDLRSSLLLSDREFYEENTVTSVRDITREERMNRFIQQQQRMLARAGIKVSGDLPQRIFTRTRELYAGMKFVLFDDVLPTMKELREHNLTIGLLTNLDRDIDSLCREVGLQPYLDFALTSAIVGAEKPHPPIFMAALEKASVSPDEALHVGDQYSVDVVGARRVGINPVLLDREDIYIEVTDCPRINTMTELSAYLD